MGRSPCPDLLVRRRRSPRTVAGITKSKAARPQRRSLLRSDQRRAKTNRMAAIGPMAGGAVRLTPSQMATPFATPGSTPTGLGDEGCTSSLVYVLPIVVGQHACTSVRRSLEVIAPLSRARCRPVPPGVQRDRRRSTCLAAFASRTRISPSVVTLTPYGLWILAILVRFAHRA